MVYEIKKAVEALFHPGIDTNLIRLIRNALLYYVSPSMSSAPPLTIYWAINNVCNLKCRMCDVGMKNKDGSFYKNLRIDDNVYEIDFNIFKSVIDEVKKDKPFIAFNSTEPLLYKNIIKAIEYCKEKGLKTSLTTNGFLLPQKADLLVKSGLQRLNVSLDGPPKIHNEIRGKKKSFENAIEGIKKFKEISEKLKVNNEVFIVYVITNLNYRNLLEFYDYIKELNIRNVNFTFPWFINNENANEHNKLFGNYYPISASCINEFIKPDLVDVKLLFDQMEKLKKKKNINFLPFFSKKQLGEYFYNTESFINNKSKCMASWFFIQILANGNVISYSRCHNSTFGNINEQKFYDIWNGGKMKNWRKFIKKNKKMPMCKRCDLVY